MDKEKKYLECRACRVVRVGQDLHGFLEHAPKRGVGAVGQERDLV